MELAADEVEEHTGLECGWHPEQRLGYHSTIVHSQEIWAWLVEQLEDCYDDLLEEWQQDIISRAVIQRAIDELSPQLSGRLAEWVRPWDERFRAATVVASRRYWDGGWWADRIPRQFGPRGYLFAAYS